MNHNLYVAGVFSGTINAGSKSITTTSNESFLLKIDPAGNSVWITKLEKPLSLSYKIKIAADNADVYIVNYNNLYRFDNSSGNLILSKTYEADLRGLALSNNKLYISGKTLGTMSGTTGINPNRAFVASGDKSGNFTKNLQMSYNSHIIDDITTRTDGSILFAGFASGGYNTAILSTGTYSFSNTVPDAGYYYFVGATDSNFNSISFLKASSDGLYNTRIRFSNVSLNLISYGTEGFFRLKVSSKVFSNSFTDFNGNKISFANTDANTNYTWLVNSNSIGNPANGVNLQPGLNEVYGSGTVAIQTKIGYRIFNLDAYNAASGVKLFSKNKSNSNGGSLQAVFHKNLRTASKQVFLSLMAEGKASIFGKQLYLNDYSRIFQRVTDAGAAVWSSTLLPVTGAFNDNSGLEKTDANDNRYISCYIPSTGSTYIDPYGNTSFISAANGQNVLLKLDRDGHLLWFKNLSENMTQFQLDKNGDVFIAQISNPATLIKISTENGETIYTKTFNNIGAYSFQTVFDNQNNCYVFCEPYLVGNSGSLVFDNVTINDAGSNNVMLKLDETGNAIWGKNFYVKNPTNTSFAWPNNTVYDGENFVMIATIANNSPGGLYIGLDGTTILSHYPTESYSALIAKINTAGEVIWQKPVHTSIYSNGNLTNVQTDDQKNIYLFSAAKGNVFAGDTETAMPSGLGNKVIEKFSSDGSLQYLKILDEGLASRTINVLGNDVFTVSSTTYADMVDGKIINNLGGYNFYIATFGDINSLASSEVSKNNINIAPNPVKNYFKVFSQNKVQKVEIYNLLGQKLTSILNQNIINATSLQKGIYIISITTEKGVTTQKIIKE